MDDKEFYYDLSKFEVNMIATRSNFLLVFQSMLFAAIASIADKTTYIPQWLLLGLGLLSSVVWLYLNLLTNTVSKAAFAKLNNLDDRINDVMENRKKNFLLSFGSVSWLMVYPFPLLTGIVWTVLLWCYFA